MAGPAPRVWSVAHWTQGLLLAGWLIGCDLWIKIVARVVACPTIPSVRSSLAVVWSVPQECSPAQLWGIARLSPGQREAALWGGPIGGSWLLVAGAVVVSIAVARWRWRTPGDALVLGALWGAIIILVGPVVFGHGVGLTEFEWGTRATGLGDLVLLWALVWLGWRVFAEARA